MPKTLSADVQRVLEARHEQVIAPIDLCIANAVPVELPNLEWMFLNRVPSKLKIANTGKTMILNPQWSGGGPRVRAGPLKSEYFLTQVHFHWGRSDDEGSEHSIEGHRLPLEMHVVCCNAFYESLNKAYKESDGTVVVAFFFVLQERDNPNLSELMPALDRVSDEGTTILHPAFALSRLLPAVRSDYLIYWGSVSGRGKRQQILWLLDRKPIGISHQQMSLFRAMKQSREPDRGSDPAPDAPPGAVFYADPSRHPLDAPTLLPLETKTSQHESLLTRMSPRSSLQSNLRTKSTETEMEKRKLQQEAYEKYKAMEQAEEKLFNEATPVPVAFSFSCRRGAREDHVDPAPYQPARRVSFDQSSQVQNLGRGRRERERVEADRSGYVSSGSSESESAPTRYYTARTSMRRRSQSPGQRKRDQSSSHVATHSIASGSSGSSAKPPGSTTQKSSISSSRRSRGEAVYPPWSTESLSPSVELASSDLSDPIRPYTSRTRPSIINTCGIDDIIVETLTQAPATKPSRITRQHPEAVAILSTRSRRGSTLSRDHPNAQPLLAKSMTGASVAGSFVQEELTRTRDQKRADESKGI